MNTHDIPKLIHELLLEGLIRIDAGLDRRLESRCGHCMGQGQRF